MRNGQLTLKINHGATNGVERFLQIKVGDRIAASQGLAVEGGQASVNVDIKPDDIRAGFIAIGLSYSGAFSEFVCVDERASGDFIQILPESMLSLTLDASQIDTPVDFNGFRPAQVYVQMPEGDEMSGLAAAIRAAALFGAEQGTVDFGTDALVPDGNLWSTSVIELDVATSGSESEMDVSHGQQRPSLHVRGTNPQLGLWQLSSEWAGVADASSSVTHNVDSGVTNTQSLLLSDFNADLREIQVVSSGQFQIPIQSSDIPEGKTVSEVDLVLAAGLDPTGMGASATVYLNDTLLGARSLDSGMPERVKFAVPEGLLSRDNLLRVLFQRQALGGQCRIKPQGYGAQVLLGSKLNLQDASDDAEHFYQLRQAFGGGAQIFVDPDVGLPHAELMPWLGSVAGTMVPDRAPIIPRNALNEIENSIPFIAVSKTNPGDTDPLIKVDGGRIEVRDRSGNIMFDGEALERLGIVQIVTRNGVKGLWLRPGTGPAPDVSIDTPFVLDRGDLALIAQQGVVVATSTSGKPLIDVVYPDRTNMMQILDRYRPWIVGGLWLALTLIVLAVFQKIYRNRRNTPSPDA
ncbi:hypothetical protein GGR95_003186 [Sulfitobacter undariae]|uniref:Cellulose synthase regulatory subunit n=1 Tax=Sulfitobacter undariae TaxID=1563671 RepID=A0A7W6E6A8_9RHOB|nr:hypothetical protein [Sulfitobacter undariae]MBB3995530.1 hypothetical protein [Sulfitobacter undariae]